MTVKIEMDMPKCCRECRFYKWENSLLFCAAGQNLQLFGKEFFNGIKNKNCPLKDHK